jgi:transitional endoplasmic reticulum ATPase
MKHINRVVFHRKVVAAANAGASNAAEPTTHRALWVLRLLVHGHRHSRSCAPTLADPDTAEELGLDAKELDALSPPMLRRRLVERLQQLEACDRAPDTICQNTRWLAEWLLLSEAEREVLAFATTVETSEVLEACTKPFLRLSSTRVIQLLATVVGQPVDAVRSSLSPSARLVRSGVLQFRPGQDYRHDSWIGVAHAFISHFAAHYEHPAELFAALCPLASKPEMSLAAFGHLSSDLDLLLCLLRGATAARTVGINILVHGPPGSGKSQLVRSLAHALSLPLYQVPDAERDGDALKGPDRLSALITMQHLLQGGGAGLILFDEIEDAFPWAVEHGWLRQGSGNDKARTNRLLEENAFPCVWVGNRVGQLDPAFLRRFSLVLELAAPPRAIREDLIARYSTGLDVPAELRAALADNDWLVPADAARAALVTRLVQEGRALRANVGRDPKDGPSPPRSLADAQVFERALCGARQATVATRQPSELAYDPAFVNTSVSLECLARGLQQRREGAVCLYGPPGTGKTAFAREVAKALDRPLVRRSAGDLLDKYVGGTERAIAEMFQEATRSDCVLLLDEAEGLMRRRDAALQSYEVTQVNELLVRMEAFRGIFLCATNGFEALDPAALRRFALRVEFLPLDGEQRLQLLERAALTLGVAVTTEVMSAVGSRLSRLALLTPGDFSSVLRGRRLLGEASVEALVRDLERAHAEKRGERRIGFGG